MKRNKAAQIIINLIMIAFCLMCIIPLISIISISLSNENSLIRDGYSLIPKMFDLTAYRYVLSDPKMILHSYGVSILVCTIGTILSVFVISGIAYPLSRQDFRYRAPLSFFTFFTLLFNGGLVATYILITKYLHLKNTIWVLILPYVANAWLILILRTFMQKIPNEIIESCQLDGAGEFRIFFQMVLPLSKPGIATVALFSLLQYWNDWWLSLLYIEKESLVPLQYMLYRMINNINYLQSSLSTMPADLRNMNLPSESARMAMAVLAVVPMLMVFPFFQKYFVKGLTVGSVKG